MVHFGASSNTETPPMHQTSDVRPRSSRTPLRRCSRLHSCKDKTSRATVGEPSLETAVEISCGNAELE